MKRCLLIINPYSGKMKINNELVDVIKILNENNYSVEVSITLNHNHAREIAREKENFDLIICSGGDGTLNQVISGIIDSNKDVDLGYIPSGSTNDFANTLGLSSNIKEATLNAVKGKSSYVDIGKFNDDYFSYVAAFGMLADVSYSTPQTAKNTLGHFAYILNGVSNISNLKAHKVIVKNKDKIWENNYILGMVMNTTSVGGILKMNNVDLNDGLFEVLLIKKPKDLVELNGIINGLISGDFDNPGFQYFKTSEIFFEFPEEMPWSLDGEKNEAGRIIHIENLQNKIKIKK